MYNKKKIKGNGEMKSKNYILSLRTKKLHFVTCRHVKRIKHEIKEYYTTDEAKEEYPEMKFCKDCFCNKD